jgi:hypothetical protein
VANLNRAKIFSHVVINSFIAEYCHGASADVITGLEQYRGQLERELVKASLANETGENSLNLEDKLGRSIYSALMQFLPAVEQPLNSLLLGFAKENAMLWMGGGDLELEV